MNRTRVFNLLLLCVLAFAGLPAGAIDAAKPPKNNFETVTFSIGCNPATKSKDRVDLERSKRAIGYFQNVECVEVTKQVFDVKLLQVTILKNEALDIYTVTLMLEPGGAQKLAELTKQGNPQKLVLSVKGEAVVAGTNFAPFHGDKFQISAETLEDARKTAGMFNRHTADATKASTTLILDTKQR